MRNDTTGVLFAACLCAAVTAQARSTTFDGFQATPASAAASDSAGGGGTARGGDEAGPYNLRFDDPTAESGNLAESGDLARYQGQDTYSLRAMFQQHHGDFMLKRERYSPPIQIRARYFPDVKVKHHTGRFDLLDGGADVNLPFLVSPDGYLSAGAYYDQRTYRTHNMAFDDETVYGAGLKAGFGVFLEDNVLFEMSTAPGVWSDLDSTLHKHDFDYPSKALLTWRATDDFFMKVGVRYNQVYKQAPWLPYLGFSWAISEHFRFDMLLPESVEFSWWPDSSFGLMIGTEVTGAQYRVRSGSATGHQQDNLQVQEILCYGGAMWRMGEYVSLLGRAGSVVAGDYHLTNGDGTGSVNNTVRTNVFFELSLGFDF